MNTLPKLFLFSGFLGSGKTTLLNHTAHYLTEKGFKIAMIINEAGETGIDNLYMKKKGYAVRELFGGCICCTLAQNLKEMVLDLNEHFSLDAILMEPSGTASPKALYKPLCQAGYAQEAIHHISILDPLRTEMFLAILEPLLAESLPLAEGIVQNKIDAATLEMLAFSDEVRNRFNPAAPVYRMNLLDGLSSGYCSYLDEVLSPDAPS
ncbi:GTP-binding protein [Eubacterium sp. 1001713B170207_170306_E7]|uniref:GTP-binding protein n=1 Tax=Eubacterium sp. 1001713B170207_170306_E7 TaxID=2787097 RepID=UPI001897D1E6|nr:GTP-binding protein [Eubacterium sp. 1001713B170207_170306_E7]